MRAIELKGCPFCGSQPAIYLVEPEIEGDSSTKIRCENDQCAMVASVVVYDDGDHMRAAADHWNTRAPQWKPIETAPRDGRPMLLDHPEWHTRVLRGGWDAHALAWRVHGFGCPVSQPTHWHPLPALPKVSA